MNMFLITRKAAVEGSGRRLGGYWASTFHYSTATNGLKAKTSSQHIQMWGACVKASNWNSSVGQK